MQSDSEVLVSTLTSEAQTFRWLVRTYVAAKVQEYKLSLPLDLRVVDQEIAFDGKGYATEDDLKEAFFRAVDMFVDDNGARLQMLLDMLPTTMRTTEECVMQVNRNVLMLGDVSWGRMVAIAAFVMKFALRCVLHEMGEAVVPVTIMQRCTSTRS